MHSSTRSRSRDVVGGVCASATIYLIARLGSARALPMHFGDNSRLRYRTCIIMPPPLTTTATSACVGRTRGGVRVRVCVCFTHHIIVELTENIIIQLGTRCQAICYRQLLSGRGGGGGPASQMSDSDRKCVCVFGLFVLGVLFGRCRRMLSDMI